MIWRLEHHCYHRQWHLLLLRLLLRHPKKVREVVSQKKKEKEKNEFLTDSVFSSDRRTAEVEAAETRTSRF